jgi:hypothetical protein
LIYFGFEFLTAVIIFWDVRPYSQVKFNRRFVGNYYFHIQVEEETSQVAGKKEWLGLLHAFCWLRDIRP